MCGPPDQLKQGFEIHTGKATPGDHGVRIVGTEAGLEEEVKKAVGECCEALEKCCEAVEECKAKAVESTNAEVVVIDDVTTAKQAEKAAQKAEKKSKKSKKPHGDV